MYDEKQKIREAMLQGECERLKIHLRDWENRYKQESEWFHRQVDESRKLADKRVVDKDTEIESLNNKIKELQNESEKQFSKSLNNVQNMDSVYALQDTLIQKRSEIEAEALKRETQFNKQKQDWLKEIEKIKTRTHEVLTQFEEEYLKKRGTLEKEYEDNNDAVIREKDIFETQKKELEKRKTEFLQWEKQTDEKLAEKEKRIDAEIGKPRFDPPPGRIVPLVKESLTNQLFTPLLEAFSKKIAHNINEMFRTTPQQFHDEFRRFHEMIDKDITDTVHTINPFDITLQPSSLTLILEETLKNFEPTCTEQKIDIKKEIIGNIPHLMLDPKKSFDAFCNIIQNSIDAVQEGGSIMVSVLHDIKAGKVIVEVEDKGGGIPRDNLEKIFDPFYSTKEGHIGIGLTLVKYIFDAMNVAVTAENPTGSGTRITCVFTLNIPSKERLTFPNT